MGARDDARPAAGSGSSAASCGSWRRARAALREHRLLPGRARVYLVASALLMALWMLLRSYKYRVISLGSEGSLLCWYGYYACQLGIVCMLFLTTLWLWERRGRRVAWLAPTVVVLVAATAAGVLTNNLHQLAFFFADGVPSDEAPYSYGPLYFAAVVLIYGLTAVSVVLLARLHRLSALAEKSFVPLVALAASGAYALLLVPMLEKVNATPFLYPEVACFSLAFVEEWLVRSRLIPSNERYGQLFGAMGAPLAICDERLRPVYRTSVPVHATKEQLREACETEVALDHNTVLRSARLKVGRIFWETDLTLVDAINAELTLAAEELEGENALLVAQNELRAQRLLIEARRQVLDDATRALGGRLEELRAQARALAVGELHAEDLSLLCVRGTYVKRAINLRLIAEEQGGALDARELGLCVGESLRALETRGVSGAVTGAEGGELSARVAERLYESFEDVVELVLPRLGALLVHVDCEACLRLVLEPAAVGALLCERDIAFCEEDDAVYATLDAKGAGAP